MPSTLLSQVNDYTYKDDPDKAQDSRYIHRGAMNWKLAENVSDPDTVEGKLFGQLGQLEQIRKALQFPLYSSFSSRIALISSRQQFGLRLNCHLISVQPFHHYFLFR